MSAPRKRKRMDGSGTDRAKKVVVRKKRRSPQAGPSYTQSCPDKENQGLLGSRQPLENQSEDSDSSCSDCISSPASSLHFGETDRVTAEEDAPVRHPEAALNPASRTLSSRSGKRPHTETDSEPELVMKRPCFYTSPLRRLPYKKRFVESLSQRTQTPKRTNSNAEEKAGGASSKEVCFAAQLQRFQ